MSYHGEICPHRSHSRLLSWISHRLLLPAAICSPLQLLQSVSLIICFAGFTSSFCLLLNLRADHFLSPGHFGEGFTGQILRCMLMFLNRRNSVVLYCEKTNVMSIFKQGNAQHINKTLFQTTERILFLEAAQQLQFFCPFK